jgi:hypothetical protein
MYLDHFGAGSLRLHYDDSRFLVLKGVVACGMTAIHPPTKCGGLALRGRSRLQSKN